MKRIFIPFFVLMTVLCGTGAAFADACSDRARAELDSYPGATLLSVKSELKANGSTVCKVRFKLKPKDGKPGRVVMRNFEL